MKNYFFSNNQLYLFLIFLFSGLSLVPTNLYAQIDVTQYASNSLFEVKPIVSNATQPQETAEKNYSSQFEYDLETALNHWNKGHHSEALSGIEDLIDENKEIDFLHYYAGQINYESKHWKEATDFFNETLKLSPLFLEAKYMLGLIAIEKKDKKTAQLHFKSLIEIPKYKAYGYHGIGLMAWEIGNHQKGYNNFRNCIEADSTFLEAYIPMINYDIYRRRIKSAKKTVEKGIAVNNEWQQGIIIRALITILLDNDVEKFEKDIDRLTEIAPDNYHYQSMKGYLQVELGNYKKAVDLFHTAYNLEVDSSRTGEFKFNSKLKKNESIQRALNYYIENRFQNTKNDTYIDRGICEMVANHRKKAISYLDSALLIEESSAAYTLKGVIYQSMLFKDKHSIPALNKAIELDSNNWVAHYYRAGELLNKGEIAPAYEDYQHVVRLKPKFKEGYKNRGIVLVQAGHLINAYRDFTKAIYYDSSDYDLFYNRSVIAAKLGYHDEAEKDLLHIINHKKNDGGAYYQLYQSKLARNPDTTAVISLLDSASKYSKYKDEYHKELLETAMENNLQSLCISAHNRLVKYNYWNSNYLIERAKFYFTIGKYKEAKLDLERFVKRKKKSGMGYYYLSKVYQKLGNENLSSRYLKKASKLGFKKEKK